MKQKVYIVIKDCSYDYDAEVVVEPFGDFDEAMGRFNSLVENCRTEAEDDDWVVDDDTAHNFSAYEEGYAARNHAYITLQISEINIK